MAIEKELPTPCDFPVHPAPLWEDGRRPAEVHAPILCSLSGCLDCELWEDGRRFGVSEIVMALRFFDWDDHGYNPEHCALAFVVSQFEEAGLLTLDDGMFEGLETDAPRDRIANVVLGAHYGDEVMERYEAGERGKAKRRIRPKADLPRPKRRARMRADVVANARPRPAPQLEFCGDCGDRFTPGVGPGEQELCPLCKGNSELSYPLPPRARPERRRALGAVPPMAAFGFSRGGYIVDDEAGPVERARSWARRTFGGAR